MLPVRSFEERARAAPGRPAVEDGSRALSYGELDAVANRLARWLRAGGLGPEGVVGLYLGRSIELVTGAVATLKAGACYLPVDPANPPGRAGRMFAQAGARLVLCGAEDLPRLRTAGVDALAVDALDLSAYPPDDLGAAAGPQQLAYVVFTSGSTGFPKGVMVSNAALANLIGLVRAAHRIGPEDRVGLVCSPSFDPTVLEVWSALASGACIDVPDAETLLDPRATVRWLAERRVTVTVLPTPLAERALQVDWPAETVLRTLIIGGDRLHVRPRAGMPFKPYNNYGPAENTVISTFGPVSSDGAGLPAIGRPVERVIVELLDEELRPIEPDAVGRVGELYLGGAQLARGYIGRPDLTAERFVPHPRPGHRGERLYRTGDLGRWLPGGELDFVGRCDDQVQVRGQRIELGEVTTVLAEHPDVSAACVIARGADGGRLVAYLAPADLRRLPAAGKLRGYLAERLPAAMVPSAFVILESLPYNANGKVDRNALPEFDRHQVSGNEYMPPRTETERLVAGIWREVLDVDRVGALDGFFELGGHSLLATQIVARLTERLGVHVPIREVFTKATLAEFATAVDEAGAADAAQTATARPTLPPIRAGSGSTVSALSVPQQQVWFLGELAPGNIAYHAQATIRVAGPLDLDVLAGALTEITRRHESLRTTYEVRDGEPCQVVRPPAPYPLARVDLGHLDAAERAARLEEVVRDELRRPFDLGELPLSRWTAIRLGPAEYELLVVEHHLVHDGWSFSVLIRELETLYNAFAEGRPPPLPDPAVQFRDYVAWQRELLASPAMAQQLDYWRHRLADAPAAMELPTDRPRPMVQGFRGNLLRLELPAALPGAIRALCRREGTSPFMVMYAAFAALLHRYTGERDLCVASGFANRRLRETEDLIGMLVNPVVLRSTVEPAATFRALLADTRGIVLDAAANQECPFPLVVRALGRRRDPSRNPLAQVTFSAHDSAVRNPVLGGSPGTVFERSNGSAKMDLNVIIAPRATGSRRGYVDDRVTVLWEYNSDLFDEPTMRAMSEAYLRMLAAAVAAPDTAIRQLPVLSGRQTRTVLHDWNPAVARALPRPAQGVHELVAEWAARTPDALAVADGAHRLSYAELHDRAARLAARLHDRGLGAEDLVAVCLPRGIETIVAELAVLIAGAAFLPIDPANPDERIRRLLARSGAKLLLTSATLRDRLAAPVPTLLVADLASAPLTAVTVAQDGLAYVVYTSGSTGEPKGVMIERYALANLVAACRQRFALTPRDRTTVVSSPGFDFSVWECWPTLTAGASLHVVPATVLLSAADLRRWLDEQRITVASLPTAVAESLFGSPWPPTGWLRCLVAAADRLTARPPAGAGVEVVNAYGPTENTVATAVGRVAPGSDARLPDIGTPIGGVAAYILDAALNPVPRGVVGELYAGGVGVARGYLGRPDLTAERFVADPFAARPGARLYRTGDLARHLPDGSIEYAGRLDDQIKIRGHRLEPAEVTAALRGLPGVRDAYTTTHTDRTTGRTHLVAYLVAAPGRDVPDRDVPDLRELRERLGATLPAPMLPTACVVLDELPRNRSGKIDRQALPAPDLSAAPAGPARAGSADGVSAGAGSAGAVSLAGERERRIARIWADILGLPANRIGAEDSFFALGGHSLLLDQVRQRIAADLGRTLPLVVLFQHPTVRALARQLDKADPGVDRADAGAEPATVGREPGDRQRGGRDRLQRRRRLRQRASAASGEPAP